VRTCLCAAQASALIAQRGHGGYARCRRCDGRVRAPTRRRRSPPTSGGGCGGKAVSAVLVKSCETQLEVLAAVLGGVEAGSAVVVGVRVAGLEVLSAELGGGKVG